MIHFYKRYSSIKWSEFKVLDICSDTWRGDMACRGTDFGDGFCDCEFCIDEGGSSPATNSIITTSTTTTQSTTSSSSSSYSVQMPTEGGSCNGAKLAFSVGGAAIALLLLLLMMGVIICLIWKRCRKREATQDQDTKMQTFSPNNPFVPFVELSVDSDKPESKPKKKKKLGRLAANFRTSKVKTDQENTSM